MYMYMLTIRVIVSISDEIKQHSNYSVVTKTTIQISFQKLHLRHIKVMLVLQNNYNDI